MLAAEDPAADTLTQRGVGAPISPATTVTTHTVLISIPRSSDEHGRGDGHPQHHHHPLQHQQYSSHVPQQQQQQIYHTRSRTRSISPSRSKPRAGRNGGLHQTSSFSQPAAAGLSAAVYGGDLAGASGWAWFMPTRVDREVALNTLAVAGASMADPLMSLVCAVCFPGVRVVVVVGSGSRGRWWLT